MALSKEYNTNLETFRVYWLDADVHNDENRASQETLRTIINHLEVFDHEDECQQEIKQVPKEDRIVLIVSGRLGCKIVPKIHNLEQLSSIYVYCMDKAGHELWTTKFKKVKEVFVRLDDLIGRIQSDHKLRRMEEESLSMINIFSTKDNADRSSTGINGQFVHYQLLIDVLLRMKSSATDKDELIALCKEQYNDNPHEIQSLDDFSKKYSPSNATWWYTNESFIYKILNKALRVQNIDLLFLFRFFIRDIYQQLCKHQEQSIVEVFRGQWISNDELDKLKHSVGDLISMNSFLSTSKKEDVACGFIATTSTSPNSSCQPVLFKITADPRVNPTKPFADISRLSAVGIECEVLFMIGSIFRLENTGQINIGNDQITIIEMSLCGDKHGLNQLYLSMRKEHEIGETNLLSLGNVLRSMGKISHAEKYYCRLRDELPRDDSLLGDVYYNLGLVAKLKCDYDDSLDSYKKALKILMKSRPSDHVVIANIHNGIGEVYWKKGDQDQALESFKQAVEIFEKAKLSKRPDMALFHDNIGLAYQEKRNYFEALFSYSQSLVIRQKCLPRHHPDLAMSYNNVGNMRLCLNQPDLALEHLKEALAIRTKALPPDHPDIAMSHKNLGNLYESTKEFKLALKSFRKASEIYHEIWPINHPDAVEIDEAIKRVSNKLEHE